MSDSVTDADRERLPVRRAEKALHARVAECTDIRKRMTHTDVMRLDGNEHLLKEAMNAFVRDGRPTTLKLWCDPARRTRAIVTLTNNPDRICGITLERYA